MKNKDALYMAWLIALVSTLAALFIGEVMGKTPCLLCWYQRIAMFPLALILGIAVFLSDFSVRRYALPLAIIGGLIALWHSLVFAGIAPEQLRPCTQTGPSCSGDGQVLFGFVPLPYLSLLSFVSIIILMTLPFKENN